MLRNVASASHFSQTYAFFPNSVLFLYVFYVYQNGIMLRILKLTDILFVFSAFMGISVDAQKPRPGSEVENMILSAVSKLNVNDIEGARDELTALLALDSENDAAW